MRKRRSGSVGPRKAAVPKAGKRKRRTKAEMEEARRREAIAKHSKPVRNVKRASRTHSYNVKDKFPDPAKKKPRTSKAFVPKMQKPRGEDIPSIVRWIDRNLSRFDTPVEALRHYQEKICEHGKVRAIARRIDLGTPKDIRGCDNCGRVLT